MTIKRVAEKERFKVRTDTGKEYTVIIYQEYIDVSSLDNPHAEIEGFKELRTSSGLHLNFIDPKTFKVVETNEIVRKLG